MATLGGSRLNKDLRKGAFRSFTIRGAFKIQSREDGGCVLQDYGGFSVIQTSFQRLPLNFEPTFFPF